MIPQIKLANLLIVLNTVLLSVLSSATSHAMGQDDPLLTMFKIDRLEYLQHNELDVYNLEAEAWLGYDLNKFWLKTEVEQEGSGTEKAELQLLYGKAISPYWELQLGLRHDFEASPSEDWAVIGFQGLAPYYLEIDTALFVGNDNNLAFRFEVEYELLFTQSLILIPELELNFYGQNDPGSATGSGLSDIEARLRLAYYLNKKFSVYTAYNYQKAFGQTAKYLSIENQANSSNEWSIGISAWF